MTNVTKSDRRRGPGVNLLATALVILGGCSQGNAPLIGKAAQASDRSQLVLKLGVYQTDRAAIMYQKFKPVANAIQDSVAQSLGRPTTVRLRIFKTYDDGLDALVEGDVDFVRFGPASYVRAKRENDGIQLLAMEQKKGKKRFRGVIVVAAKSPIHTLADLKSRSFAFGDRNSTIGRYLSQAELVKAGIRGRDLSRYEYLDRHDKVAKAVMIGDFDAGAVKENTFKRFNTGGDLRLLHAFDNVTKPWIARSDLPEDVVATLTDALMNLKDADALKSLKVDGFFPATDDDYELVTTGMQIAETFDE